MMPPAAPAPAWAPVCWSFTPQQTTTWESISLTLASPACCSCKVCARSAARWCRMRQRASRASPYPAWLQLLVGIKVCVLDGVMQRAAPLACSTLPRLPCRPGRRREAARRHRQPRGTLLRYHQTGTPGAAGTAAALRTTAGGGGPAGCCAAAWHPAASEWPPWRRRGIRAGPRDTQRRQRARPQGACLPASLPALPACLAGWLRKRCLQLVSALPCGWLTALAITCVAEKLPSPPVAPLQLDTSSHPSASTGGGGGGTGGDISLDTPSHPASPTPSPPWTPRSYGQARWHTRFPACCCLGAAALFICWPAEHLKCAQGLPAACCLRQAAAAFSDASRHHPSRNCPACLQECPQALLSLR